MKKLLICGLGSIGRRYLRIIRNNWPLLEIGILRSGKGPNYSEKDLADVQFTTIQDAIRWGPNTAIIATPASSHLKQAITLAKEGISLLIEKPIGIGNEPSEKWNQLILLSREIPILLGYCLRHDPCAHYIQKQLQQKYLGMIIEADFYCGSWLPSWRPELDYLKSVSSRKELGGGVLLELSHELDLANWLIGPFNLTAASINSSDLFPIDVEDQAILLGKNINNTLITIRLNFCSNPSKRIISFRGEKGELNWDVENGTVEKILSDHPVKKMKLGITRDDLFINQLKHFFSCYNKESNPNCTIVDGLNVLKLVKEANLLSLK